MKRQVVLALILPLRADCMVRETRHVRNLDPADGVTRTVMETGVPSCAGAAAARAGVEMGCLGRIKVGDHAIIRVLVAFSPWRGDSRTPRDLQASGRSLTHSRRPAPPAI